MIRQITWQSNLFALLLASLHLWKPNLLILKSNYLFIITASLLATSSITFWFVLLPIFLNLNALTQSLLTPAISLIFWNIWNHLVTPLSFFNLLVSRLKSQDFKWAVSKKVAYFRYKFYWAINLLGNVYFSFDGTQPSAYGVASNWYWGKRNVFLEKGNDLQQPLIISYNFQLSFFAFFIVMAIALLSFTFFWSFFGPKNDSSNKPIFRLGFWINNS